jgi:pyruvate dehydrogenase E2 component (dihydrolipoamide acetyltransferase)
MRETEEIGMAKSVPMPKIGITVESCVITEWKKKIGDTVDVGDVLFSYETDKAAFDCESTVTGTILTIFYGNGDEVPVLANVCVIGNPGEDVSGFSSPAKAAETPPIAENSSRKAEVTPTVSSGEIKISPRARHLAENLNLDYRATEGSGPYGRVIERDIRALAGSGAGVTPAAFAQSAKLPPGSFSGTGLGGRIRVDDLSERKGTPTSSSAEIAVEYRDVPFSGIRKAIAKSMTQSLATIPQLTHNFSFNASELTSLRTKIKAGREEGLKGIGIGDMILFAVSRILPGHQSLNAHMLGESTIRLFGDVNLGFACDTERGLMVPVIRTANRKSLLRISEEVRLLAKQAQSGNLSPDHMTGGTFTVSNLGTTGVESFTPVIYPPQTGILGVNGILQRPREDDGQIKLYPAMGLSLTYDHRAIDGAPASRFMRELCDALENFTLLLLSAG